MLIHFLELQRNMILKYVVGQEVSIAAWIYFICYYSALLNADSI